MAAKSGIKKLILAALVVFLALMGVGGWQKLREMERMARRSKLHWVAFQALQLDWDWSGATHTERIERIVKFLKTQDPGIDAEPERRVIRVGDHRVFVYPGENADSLIFSVNVAECSRYEIIVEKKGDEFKPIRGVTIQ